MFEKLITNPDFERLITAITKSVNESQRAVVKGSQFWFRYRLVSAKRMGVRPYELRCTDPRTKRPYVGASSFRPSAEGEGMYFWRCEVGAIPTVAILELRWEDEVTFQDLGTHHFETSARQTIEVPGDFHLELATILDHPIREAATPTVRHRKRFPIALVGTAAQIKLVVPMMHGSCLQVRRLFISDSAIEAPHINGAKTLPLSELNQETTTDLFAVLDFSGHERAVQLKGNVQRPGSSRGAIVVIGLEGLLASPARFREVVSEVLEGILPSEETRHAVE